jgi:acetyl-CoA carboxylase carboxyl transferase subunit beta
MAAIDNLAFDEFDPTEAEEEFDLDLACPTCGADLIRDELFRSQRVCSACRRHFWIPARERLQWLVDPGSFAESNQALVSLDPLVFHDRLPVADRLAEAREQPGVSEAVITGFGAISGEPTVLVALDLAVIGSNIGILAGEKIALAMEAAIARRLPLIAVCSGTNGRSFEGVLSLTQLARLASLAGRLHAAGLPFIALATHPTSGNVQLGFAYQADIILAEPAAHVGFEPSQRTGEPAETLLARGEIDAIVERNHQRDFLAALLNLLGKRGVTRPRPAEPIAERESLTPWGETRLIRRDDRPTALDYVHLLSPSFTELHGDRLGSDAPSVAIGLGRIDGVAVALIAVQRGAGALTAGAYRKASRLLRLAEHLEMPVVTLIDAPNDESAGASMALAAFLGEITRASVPLVSVALGECGGATAFPFLIADRLLVQEHALVTMPQAENAATARDCLRWGIADAIVREPGEGAHEDRRTAANQLEIGVSNALAELSAMGQRRLLDDRGRRLRTLGMASAEVRESVNVEIRELQEWQKLVTRSFEELRQRWEHRQLALPTFSGKPSLPHLPGKMALPAISLPKFTFKKPDFSEFADRMATARKNAARRADPPPERDVS